MSDFIVIQVGQCGNQIGRQFWTLALKESGLLEPIRADSPQSNCTVENSFQSSEFANLEKNELSSSFFWNHEKTETRCKGLETLERKQITAKAILVDMEDGVVSRLQQSKIGDLFDEKLKVTHYPGSGNNWVVGHAVHGKRFHDALVNVIQHAVEKCECLQGFILLCSLGGGTGSGLGTYILQMLEENYPEVGRFVGCVYPEGNDDVITSPYNVLMSSKILTDHATCIFPFDNKALINICNQVNLRNGKKAQPTRDAVTAVVASCRAAVCKPYEDMNSLIVNMLLHLTSSSRFPGSLNLDINEIYSNMVPFPKMQYISSGLSPLQVQNGSGSLSFRPDELFSTSWSRENQLCRCIDPNHSTLLSVSLIGRGPLSLADMRRNIDRLQSKVTFAPWASESIKVGLCSVPAQDVPASLLSLFNSTGIIHLLGNALINFSKLYSRKAHLHHYLTEGVEICDIEDSYMTVQDVISNYKAMESKTPQNVMAQLNVY